MKAWILLATALALTPLPQAWAKTQKVQETKLPGGLVVHEYKLDNGLQLLLVPDSSAPVFSYQVWFKVGSVTEKMDPQLKKTGLAHLFEHMMFRGTPKNPDQIFDKRLSSAGAVGLNATTWIDRTNYFESLPKDKLELAFELESDRMSNLIINEKLFKTELGAVMGELKMRNDKPASVAYEKLWDLAFDQHAYKYSVIGTPDELNSFTVANAMHFYKTYYAPNNATVILLGDFKIPQAIALAEKYYGKIPSQTIPHFAPVTEPEQKAARSREETHPLATSDILMLGFKVPAITHTDMPAIAVAGAALAYGNGSWLEQDLVQENIASGVSASATMARYPSLFIVSVQMAPGKDHRQALKTIRRNLDRLQKGDISAAEIERAKNQYLLHAYTELQNISEVGDNLGEALVTADDYTRNFQILEELKKVTAADLQRVAKAYFTDARSSLVRMSPAAKGKN